MMKRKENDLDERRRLVAIITEHLEAAYGLPVNERPDDPLDELIATILSQSTSDINSHRAFASLKRKYPDWEAARRARRASIAAAIRGGGLAEVKSIVIKNALDEIRRQRGALDLNFLKTAPLPEAIAFLSSLKGVGPKTVGCVLLFACRRPVFPMDTHILRITRRLELVPANLSDAQSHQVMAELIPDGKHYSLHINLIRHGREVCRPRDPRCERCVLFEYCPYGQARAGL
jgi:endonuclease-3